VAWQNTCSCTKDEVVVYGVLDGGLSSYCGGVRLVVVVKTFCDILTVLYVLYYTSQSTPPTAARTVLAPIANPSPSPVSYLPQCLYALCLCLMSSANQHREKGDRPYEVANPSGRSLLSVVCRSRSQVLWWPGTVLIDNSSYY